MKINLLFIIFSFSIFAQELPQISDTLSSFKEKKIHDSGVYSSFQFPYKSDLLLTPQAWIHFKKIYFEARYNYEAINTFSLYCGRSFLLGKNEGLEIIPGLGGSLGIFNGVSPYLGVNLGFNKITLFSQNQYSINTSCRDGDFFFSWSAIMYNAYKSVHFGVSEQVFVPVNGNAIINYGPMLSLVNDPFSIEFYAYNFWDNNSMWAVGLQVLF